MFFKHNLLVSTTLTLIGISAVVASPLPEAYSYGAEDYGEDLAPLPDYAPEYVPEYAPDYVPEYVPEYVPDYPPEDIIAPVPAVEDYGKAPYYYEEEEYAPVPEYVPEVVAPAPVAPPPMEYPEKVAPAPVAPYVPPPPVEEYPEVVAPAPIAPSYGSYGEGEDIVAPLPVAPPHGETPYYDEYPEDIVAPLPAYGDTYVKNDIDIYANKCSSGPVQCCNSVQESSAPSVVDVLGLLGVVLDGLVGNVGLTCNSLLGGGSCTAQTVCCDNVHFTGLVAMGCQPINIGL
ncbi:hypothetical protein PC9H_005570 [Pleurotus ostreatus]|uniref:Hydrophobin n=1 Tax=Pleurotus ostreatus TaxID=5322 RepID=A0A8H7A054_PLEOS|nr:uncharacterized protein PC9H_005570 [Pleurotus ostreatus]KAF7433609.1 hypothetical protein PC9H_005570 [Pleurotus ostreatus]KAJ8697651.1 hypothetical protein PTI98_004433 [Pleurotus ostreatus]